MKQEFTAATLDAAKAMAAEAFGAPVSEISFTILEEPKSAGLFGLFKKSSGEYRVEAEYTAPAAKSAASSVLDFSEEPSITETAEAVAEDLTEVATELKETKEDAAENLAEAAEETTETSSKRAPADPAVCMEKMRLGAEYLETVLAKLCPDVKVESKLTASGVEMELVGGDSGALIGRRGETLDALQYLTSMVANRGDRDYLRISIDTCDYRDKRKKALQELAQRISKNVLRSGRSIALEPMNPYERRIIHSTVTEIEGVSSHSSGEEPNRKVIITSDNPQAARFDRRNGRDGDRRNNRGRNDRSFDRNRKNNGERKTGEGVRKLDLSTSFEKDYKRPKPEDSLNAGVYGKIEID